MALPESTDDPKVTPQEKKESEKQEQTQQQPPQPQQKSQSKELTDDKDFDPSPEALIDDIDDERTLEEEEAHGDLNQARVQEELDDLNREAEMPIEELLAYYERMRQQETDQAGAQDQEEEEEEEEFDDNDEDEEDDDDEEDDEEAQTKRVPDNKNPDDDKDNDGNSSGQGGTKRSSTGSPSPAKKSADEQGRPQPKSESGNTDQQNSEHVETQQQSQFNPTPTVTILDGQPKQQSITPSENTTSNNNHQNDNLNPETIDATWKEPPQQDTTEKNDDINANNSELITPLSDSLPVSESLTHYLLQQNPSSVFQTLLNYELEDSEDDDYSYTSEDRSDDERDWRRSIHVGSDHQAEVPKDLSEYDNLPPYQLHDTLVWTSHPNMSYTDLIDYLKKSSSIQRRKDISISSASVPRITQNSLRQWKHLMASNTEQPQVNEPSGFEGQEFANGPDVYMNQSRKKNQIELDIERENTMDGSIHGSVNEGTSDSTSQDNNKPELSTEDYFHDEEQLLYLLLQCNYNIDEALRRRTLDPFKYYFHEPMSLWSESECLAFESGLRTFGKDFRLIRENNVPTRTHAELVSFYYLWKKSERHDVYTNRYKLDRKRSLTHPGTTDYMDNFIDDTLKLNNSSSSPSTPPINNINNISNSSNNSSGANNTTADIINVNIDLANDSGVATPSCTLSDHRSPQQNTPNQSQQVSLSNTPSSNIHASISQSHQILDHDGREQNHRESVFLDSNLQM